MLHTKKLIPLAASALLLSMLVGCGSGSDTVAPPSSDTEETPPPVVEEITPPPYTGPINPLTGLPLTHGSVEDRPIAVMLNNLKVATPQQGNAQADIIYEVPAEGGITRMLAVYQNTEEVGAIGSVRSSRPYYLELALGHDAIYLHAGGSPDAYSKIKTWNVTALDCVRGGYEGTLYWRDSERRKSMGYEHSVLTSGEAIAKYFPDYNIRKTHEEGYTYEMRFLEDAAPVSGLPAAQVTVPFSHYKTGVFDYDAATGRYLVSEYDAPYVDGNSGEQVACTNLLILKTSISMIPGDDKGRMSVDLSGSGEGWFACGGKYIPITWEKSAPAGQLRYALTDGTPLSLQCGNSYVCIVPNSTAVSFT